MENDDRPLIRTKLAPPKMGRDVIVREPLLRQLERTKDCRLSLVLAPAGGGKTTLLTQWRKNLVVAGARVAWFNAGPDDDDAATATYLVESLRQIGLAMRTEGLELFIRTGGKAWMSLLASIVNDLSDQPGPTYLFIDDCHYISSFTLLQLLNRWVALAPAGFHLVMGSRAMPRLDLAKLRADGEVAEITFAELRFDRAETERFVVSQGLDRLTEVQVDSLHEMTDGWAAGLQWLTYSLRKGKSPEEFFRSRKKLSLLQDESLDDYLEHSAAEMLTPAELDFLSRAAICRRFTADLCATLTGTPSAAGILGKFVNENLFLIPIDTTDPEPWFRFHRLFGTFLAKRLERQHAADVPALHRRAGEWFAARGHHIEAMRHAQWSGDPDFLLALIDRSARHLIRMGSFVELLDLCESVPREKLITRINVGLSVAWAQLSCFRFGEFGRLLADLEKSAAGATPVVRREIELLKAYRAARQDDTATALRILEALVAEHDPANAIEAVPLLTVYSSSLAYANHYERAREVARSRHRYDISDRPGYPLPHVDVIPGFSHLLQGHIQLALALLSPYIERAIGAKPFGAEIVGLFGGYLVEAYYQSDRIQLARMFLERYGELFRAPGFQESTLYALRVRARIEQLDGNRKAAAETLRSLEEFGYRHGLDRLVAWSLHEQVAESLRNHQSAALDENLRRLDRLADQYADCRNCAWSEIVLAAKMAHADAAFARSVSAASLETIDSARKFAIASGRMLPATHLGFLRAIVLLSSGESVEALRLGRELAEAAAVAGMKRVVLDLGGVGRALVEALLDSELTLLAREFLESAVPASPARPTAGPQAGVPEIEHATSPVNGPGALSARERDILDLLSKALSVKSIARAFDLSPGTVKWHMRNIYGKLGAVSREEALAKARAGKIME